MDITELRKLGGVTPEEPELVEVVWDDRLKLPDSEGRVYGDPEWVPTYGDGKVHKFNARVKQICFGDIERLRRNPVDPENPDRSTNAVLISESVLLGEKGDERMSYEDAFKLKPSLAQAFLEAIGSTLSGKS